MSFTILLLRKEFSSLHLPLEFLVVCDALLKMQVRKCCKRLNLSESDLLMAAVPFPGVARPAGKKVRGALVLDSLREPQQHTCVVVSHAGPVCRAAQQKQPSGYKISDIPWVSHIVLTAFRMCILAPWPHFKHTWNNYRCTFPKKHSFYWTRLCVRQ